MTRTRNARVAGFTFLLYIASGVTALILSGRAASGEGSAAKLASIAQHVSQMRLAVVLVLLGCICALVLAVTLYSITRDEDPDLAMLGLTCRVAEGVIGAVSLQSMLGKTWLATVTGAEAPDPAAAKALSAVLFELPGWSATLCAIFFALGSTFFCYLLLRGRMIPVVLAWLGVVASILLLAALPLALVGVLRGLSAQLIWIPMAVFEVWVALWFLIKGVAVPVRRQAA